MHLSTFCIVRKFSTNQVVSKVKVENGYWTNKKVQRDFLKSIEGELGIKNWSDWYEVKVTDVASLGGGAILYHYNGSLAKCLQELFPEHSWKPWQFHSAFRNFWQNKSNHRLFLEDFAKKHNITSHEGWYSITNNDIIAHGGQVLMAKYFGSLSKLLVENFPEYKWEFFKMRNVPNGYWQVKENQLYFINYLSKELNISNMEDWYKVTADMIRNKGGTGLLAIFNNSPMKMFRSLFPEYPWKLYKFERVAKNYWDDLENQKEFFDDIAKKLNLKHWTDWYKVRVEDISKEGGFGLLAGYYKESIYRALIKIYPEYPWIPWEFRKIPEYYWDDIKNVREAMDYAAKKLNIKKIEDWKEVSNKQIMSIRGFKTLVDKYRGVYFLLKAAYPNEQCWDDFGQFQSGKLTQNILHRYLQELFPSIFDIYINYPHPTMLFKSSNMKMELDIYIPSLNLAFEYQGVQHYSESSIEGELTSIQKRDEEKRQACKENGITLIEIPHWWDATIGSLKATIKKQMPNLIPEEVSHSPIPESRPVKYRERKLSIPYSVSPLSFRNSTFAFPVQWDEKTWEQISNTEFNYFIARELGTRNPKCSGCGKTFSDKLELRVTTLGTTVFSEVKMMTRIHFCLSDKCLESASKTGIFIEKKLIGVEMVKSVKIMPFDWKIGVPYQYTSILSNFPQEGFKNIEFVVQYE